MSFGQGYASMGPAVSALERAVLDRTLKQDGGPVMTWCLSNAVVTTDPTGARKLDKARAREKIDWPGGAHHGGRPRQPSRATT